MAVPPLLEGACKFLRLACRERKDWRTLLFRIMWRFACVILRSHKRSLGLRAAAEMLLGCLVSYRTLARIS